MWGVFWRKGQSFATWFDVVAGGFRCIDVEGGRKEDEGKKVFVAKEGAFRIQFWFTSIFWWDLWGERMKVAQHFELFIQKLQDFCL